MKRICPSSELAQDPRDEADRARLADEVAQVFKCVSCYECERVCPTEIPIVSEAIQPLKRLVYRRGEAAGARRAHACSICTYSEAKERLCRAIHLSPICLSQ